MQNYARLIPEITVLDLGRSLRFWRDLIGFEVAYDRPEDRFAFLDLGGAQIMLEQFDASAVDWITGPLDYPFGRGLNLQIEVASLAPILARLEQASWPLFIKPDERWHRVGPVSRGQRRALVLDPDGYLLRLAQPLGTR